jgi:hypothetical protein
VWSREAQWEPLWEDVATLAERVLDGQGIRPHFLGAIVLDQLPHPTGGVETRLVIDGQQRLTTLQLLLRAFQDFCGGLDTEDGERFRRALEGLTRNPAELSPDPDEKQKVWPTSADQLVFREVMQAGSLRAVRHSPLAHRPIAQAYCYFQEQVRGWLEDQQPHLRRALDALYETLRNKLRLVVIDLDNDDDAQVIFETLNARGTPLLPSDLVKNLLFHRLRLEGAPVDELYRQHWQHFDENQFWRTETAAGRVRRANIDLFLQYYLTLRLRQEVQITHLYETFRQFALREQAPPPREQLVSLQSYAQTYANLAKYPVDTPEGRFFSRLQALETTTAYPFLFELFHRQNIEPAVRQQVLGAIESYLIRRMVCRLTTKNYNRFFVELLEALDGGGPLAPRVEGKLLEGDGDSVRWPRDEELRDAFVSRRAYGVIAQRRLNVVLRAIEEHRRDTKSDLQFGDLTLEHLMPQAWEEHWPPPPHDGGDAIERRRLLLQSLGNLTLLTQPLNSAVSNGPWQQKRDEILRHSAIGLNRELSRFDDWNEERIVGRGGELYEDARRIWPVPSR